MTKIPRINEINPCYMPDGHWFDSDGDEVWIKDGKYHREDGPATISPIWGKRWRQHGHFHRVDGPAIIWDDGFVEWYYNGNAYLFDEWLEANDYITDSQKVFLKLKYG